MEKYQRWGSLIVNYVLPVSVAVGAGLITYALTGGEEEYPAQAIEEQAQTEATKEDAQNNHNRQNNVSYEAYNESNSLIEGQNTNDFHFPTDSENMDIVLSKMEEINDDVQDIKVQLITPCFFFYFIHHHNHYNYYMFTSIDYAFFYYL